MDFKINNGLGILSIGLSEIGSYFKFKRPLAIEWEDCAGSVGRYLCVAGYSREYREAIRSQLLKSLEKDYSKYQERDDIEQEIYSDLSPLLNLLPNGNYTLNYFNGRESKPFEYITKTGNYYHDCITIFNEEAQNQADYELKYHQYLQSKWKYPWRDDLVTYTTPGFIEWELKILIATIPKTEIDQERVKYFENLIRNGTMPYAIIYNCYLEQFTSSQRESDKVADIIDYSLVSGNYVIDGHHKLLAYRNLKITPSIVEIKHYPKDRNDLDFNVEELIESLYPWQMEHLLKNWEERDKYIEKALQNPQSKIHDFIKNGLDVGTYSIKSSTRDWINSKRSET